MEMELSLEPKIGCCKQFIGEKQLEGKETEETTIIIVPIKVTEDRGEVSLISWSCNKNHSCHNTTCLYAKER